MPDIDYKKEYPEPWNPNLTKGPVREDWVEEPLDAQLMDEIFEQILYRNRMILEADGEEMGLYRRKLSGQKCPCVDPNRETPVPSCRLCYGTMWIGGYDYIGTIKVRIAPAPKIRMLTELGLKPDFRPKAWTMMEPVLTTRDVLVGRRQLDEVFEIPVKDEPVIRGNYRLDPLKDALSHVNVTEIIRISDEREGEEKYKLGRDYNLVGDFIVWISPNQPTINKTYFVTYTYVLSYTRRYMVGDITVSTQRARRIRQEFSLEEMEPTHPMYTFPSIFDPPIAKVNLAGNGNGNGGGG